MKIVMFTPALQASAIGRVACMVTRALIANGHTVTVVRAEADTLLTEPVHPFDTKMVPWNDATLVRPLLAEADLLVYQIGDNYTFHRGCMEWLPHAPGVVCLHDFFIAHLFWAWAEDRRAEAMSILSNWYGADVAQAFFCHSSSESFINATHCTAPLTEWISSMATGVITHSNWGVERVLQGCAGPVRVVPLPYDAPNIANQRDAAAQGDIFRVLTVGHVNPNKRVACVIRAIGASDALRQSTVYRIVGAIEPAVVVELSSLARNSKVNLVISDQVEGPILASAFEESDVITCLRFPSLEAASASAIEAMLCGRPVIVTNINFYSEIPDDCVIKIDQADEAASLKCALEKLRADPALRQEMGARAQRWARDTFRADRYAECLAEMAVDSSRAQPILGTINVLSRTMNVWGASTDMLSGAHTSAPLKLLSGL